MIYNAWFWCGCFALGGLVLILPTVIGVIRRVEDMDLVILFNVLTLVTGVSWFGALLLACMNPRRLPPERPVILPVGQEYWQGHPDVQHDDRWPLAG